MLHSSHQEKKYIHKTEAQKQSTVTSWFHEYWYKLEEISPLWASKNKGLDFGGFIAGEVTALMRWVHFRLGRVGYKT